MSIRVDVTEYSTVVRCSHCPYWYWQGGGGERARGHRVAQDHEASVHPGVSQAHEARKRFEARAKNVPASDGSSQRGAAADDGGDRVGDQSGRSTALS